MTNLDSWTLPSNGEDFLFLRRKQLIDFRNRSVGRLLHIIGEPFLIVLAAEGTRTKGEYWKSGFWRLARAAKLPIVLAFIDGPSRTSGFGPTITATSDVVADMDQVRAFYADKRGIHPERRTEPRLREELTAGGDQPAA